MRSPSAGAPSTIDSPCPLRRSSTSTSPHSDRDALNLGVFPVHPATKEPRFAKWQRGGLRDPRSIKSVFERNPDSAIGVPGGQLFPFDSEDVVIQDEIPVQLGRYAVVLDVDERNLGIEALSEIRLPRTSCAKTPNGYHFWFWSRTPVAAFTRPDGLEIKALGTYTMVPPAPERAWTRNPFDYPIAEVPDFLVERVPGETEIKYRPNTKEWSLDFGDPLELIRSALSGSRRPTLLRQAGRMNYHLVWKSLLDERTAKDHLRGAALANGTEPKEIERILKYVFDSPPFSPATSSPPEGALLTVVATLSDEEQSSAGGNLFGLRTGAVARCSALLDQKKADRLELARGTLRPQGACPVARRT